MRDIEIAIGTQFILGSTKVICTEGSDCNNCIFHKETAYDHKQIQIRDFWGRTRLVNTSMQCGGIDYEGYPNGRLYPLVCDKDTRRDGKDVVFIEIETMPHVDNENDEND